MGGLADTRQTVYLRAGGNQTVNVASGTAAGGNSNAETMTIYGSADNDLVKLGGGNDVVVIGGLGEVVTAIGGHPMVQTTAAVAGAQVNGAATGTTTRSPAAASPR